MDWRDELWPHGGKINIGAYGGTPQASLSPYALIGRPADINRKEAVDLSDLAELARQWSTQQSLRAEDLDRNGVIDLDDLVIFANQWLWK